MHTHYLLCVRRKCVWNVECLQVSSNPVVGYQEIQNQNQLVFLSFQLIIPSLSLSRSNRGPFNKCVRKVVYRVFRSIWHSRWDQGNSVWSWSPIIPVHTLYLFKWSCCTFSQASLQSAVCSEGPSCHSFSSFEHSSTNGEYKITS